MFIETPSYPAFFSSVGAAFRQQTAGSQNMSLLRSFAFLLPWLL